MKRSVLLRGSGHVGPDTFAPAHRSSLATTRRNLHWQHQTVPLCEYRCGPNSPELLCSTTKARANREFRKIMDDRGPWRQLDLLPCHLARVPLRVRDAACRRPKPAGCAGIGESTIGQASIKNQVYAECR